MLAVGDEALEMGLGVAKRIGARHADNVEALRAGLRVERRLDAVQKSRSA
jgi:hypothetical protein